MQIVSLSTWHNLYQISWHFQLILFSPRHKVFIRPNQRDGYWEVSTLRTFSSLSSRAQSFSSLYEIFRKTFHPVFCFGRHPKIIFYCSIGLCYSGLIHDSTNCSLWFSDASFLISIVALISSVTKVQNILLISLFYHKCHNYFKIFYYITLFLSVCMHMSVGVLGSLKMDIELPNIS